MWAINYQTYRRIIRTSRKCIAWWVKTHCVDICFMTIETLHTLTCTNIPNHGLAIGALKLFMQMKIFDYPRYREQLTPETNMLLVSDRGISIVNTSPVCVSMKVLDHLTAFHIPNSTRWITTTGKYLKDTNNRLIGLDTSKLMQIIDVFDWCETAYQIIRS